MCEFCTEHGEGKIWYKNSANYSQDLLSDLKRRTYIENFLSSTISEGFTTLGRLETIFRKKGRLPGAVTGAMVSRAKTEHFGQVLPLEEIREVVLSADTIVRMPCACRWTAQKKEVRCCYGISFGPEPWYKGIDMSYFGKPPGDGLETLQREEALQQMEGMEEHGAIHTIWTMVTPFIGAICNCSARDCIAMKTLSGIRVEIMARAEFNASVAPALCNGCGLCVEQCQFDAIGSTHEEGRCIAEINSEACFGCGLCRRACPSGAISLVAR
jgi:ferredoxin